jgi:outer membrane protein TolC
VETAWRAGATTSLDVVDAERTARDADSAAVIAEDAARQARLDLLAAAGKFP